MPNIEARADIAAESRKRVKLMHFGDPITNICAGRLNPHRHGYFVKKDGRCIECTDKKGDFWATGMDVIHKGHLGNSECKKLFQPVWESQYG